MATFRIGLLGHGTVGGAFEELLAERADAIVHLTGMRPEIVGVLTRSRGDFASILEQSDLLSKRVVLFSEAAEDDLRARAKACHALGYIKKGTDEHLLKEVTHFLTIAR